MTPQAGDVWTVGAPQNVTWDTSKIPPSAEDGTGTLLLGYYDDSGGENLDIGEPDHPTSRHSRGWSDHRR
jgi:hypothetical protein